MSKKVIVVGAGAAGLIASAKAAEKGCDVILVEKNDIVGKKILITGKGRCNITNNTDIDGLIQNIPGNGNFLYSAFYTFSNHDLIAFLNKNGLKTKVERGERVFPLSNSSRDVVELLKNYAKNKGVRIILNSPASEILARQGKVYGLKLKNGQELDCHSVILATGGASYPGTGTTGDGYKMAAKLGHSIIPLKPSLVPLITAEKWVAELQGLSLKNVEITMYNKADKKVYEDFGEMLFTHYGVSGPIILSASRHIMDYEFKDIRLVIDLKPALSEELLDNRLLRDFEKYSRKQYKNSLNDLLPKKLIPVVIHMSGIDGEKPVNQITRDERRKLVNILKNFELNIIGSRPIKEAIVTAGGVNTDEINPSTMESKLIKGLYFAGEVIDLDGYTGGFNLTIAFSTGYLAGINC
jgi:predicted Rossmann fold flavoprotein